jgi:hypothetical protein
VLQWAWLLSCHPSGAQPQAQPPVQGQGQGQARVQEQELCRVCWQGVSGWASSCVEAMYHWTSWEHGLLVAAEGQRRVESWQAGKQVCETGVHWA